MTHATAFSRNELFAQICERARRHGEESEPDHEIGDLQDALDVLLSLVPDEKLAEIPRRLADRDMEGWEEEQPIDPGAGYRLLDAEETVRDGDERLENGIWTAVPGLQIGEPAGLDGPVRRPVGPSVRARLRTDDGVFEVEFDAASWLSQADDSDILALTLENAHSDEWFGRGWRSDVLAEHFAGRLRAVDEVNEYLAVRNQAPDDGVGSSVLIHKKDLVKWAAENRPRLLPQIADAGDDL